MEKSLKTKITKEKILKAAVEEFGTYGYEGASVNRICEKHGISKGLIYHNFESRDNLYLCCAEEAVNKFINYMSGKDFSADVNLYMKERYKFFEENPFCSKLIFGIILTDNKDFSEQILKIKDKFDSFNKGLYINTVESLNLRNGVSKEDAVKYYSLMQNMLNNYLSVENNSDGNFDFAVSNHEKALAKLLDFMLYGIARENEEKKQ